jgi:hypothetical protein
MYHLHIRIPKETHDRLVAETIKNPKAKNKSEHARQLLKAALGAEHKGAEIGPASIDRVERSLEALRQVLDRTAEHARFAAVALGDLMKRDPALLEDARRRASEPAPERADRVSSPVMKTPRAPPKPEAAVRDPRTMTKDELAAWKRQLARELTEED